MKNAALKIMPGVTYIIVANFYIAVIVLIGGCLLSVTGASIFEFNQELYGALDNNLQMMMIYLAMTEAVVVGYSLSTKNHQLMVAVGFFLILIVGSLEFYGEVNSIAIDTQLYPFFLYTGLSHSMFGFFVPAKPLQSVKTPSGNAHT